MLLASFLIIALFFLNAVRIASYKEEDFQKFLEDKGYPEEQKTLCRVSSVISVIVLGIPFLYLLSLLF